MYIVHVPRIQLLWDQAFVYKCLPIVLNTSSDIIIASGNLIVETNACTKELALKTMTLTILELWWF